MTDIKIEKAKMFAKTKHGDGMRKYGNVPYYTHPFAVADRLKKLQCIT